MVLISAGVKVPRARATLRTHTTRRMGFRPLLSGYQDPSSRGFNPLTSTIELQVPTIYQGWSEANAKIAVPRGPDARWGTAFWQAEQPSGHRDLSPREVAAESLRAQALELGMCSSNPNFAIYVCPRASNITHSAPRLATVLRDQLDKLMCAALRYRALRVSSGAVPSIALTHIGDVP